METGYFDKEKREYVITNMHPVRPLKNYLWNQSVVANYDQFGFGVPQMQMPTGFKPLDFEEHLVYVKKAKTKMYYSPNRNYDDLPFDLFCSHVGIGYQKIESIYQGLKVTYTIMIPHEGYQELLKITLENLNDTREDYDVYHLLRPHVNVTWHTAYNIGKFDKKNNMLRFSHVGYEIEDQYVYVYNKADYPIESFDVSGRFFKGFYRNFDHPIGLEQERLSSKETTFEDQFVAALHFKVTLKPKEIKEIHLGIGVSQNIDAELTQIEKQVTKEYFEKELKLYQKEAEQMEKVFEVETPDPILNIQVNTWLKRQIALGKTWGRVYGKGFRDVMQDISAFVSLDSSLARERILYTLRYQKKDGNTIRQFDPIFDYPYRDGASWIPATILSYLKESNDASILKEKVAYYDDEKEETVLEHMLKGLDFLLNQKGEHHLTLWGGGDWNDSLNNCGRKGKGESVWLSIATIKAVHDLEEIIIHYHLPIDYSSYLERAEDMKKAILTYGWDKDHFIYGYNDEGEKIGSYETEEGQIYLNPQTWAVLADIVSKEEALKLCKVIDQKLKAPFGYVQVYPSYSKGDDHIGRASYFQPGTYENGSCYLHGVAFKIAADLKLKEADRAYETLLSIRYDNPKNPDSGMEPYATSNMFIGPECTSLKGYAPLSWITGTAGWLYKDITEMLLGIDASYDALILRPCLPSAWKKVKIKRVMQKETFEITIEKTGVMHCLYDGKELTEPVFKLQNREVTHRVYYSY